MIQCTNYAAGLPGHRGDYELCQSNHDLCLWSVLDLVQVLLGSSIYQATNNLWLRSFFCSIVITLALPIFWHRQPLLCHRWQVRIKETKRTEIACSRKKCIIVISRRIGKVVVFL